MFDLIPAPAIFVLVAVPVVVLDVELCLAAGIVVEHKPGAVGNDLFDNPLGQRS